VTAAVADGRAAVVDVFDGRVAVVEVLADVFACTDGSWIPHPANIRIVAAAGTSLALPASPIGRWIRCG
jgi:hypothetical protein